MRTPTNTKDSKLKRRGPPKGYHKLPLGDGELLLSHKGLTALTGYSELAIRRMVKARVVPHVRIGRSVRFPRADIIAWIEAHKVPAASDRTQASA